MLCAESGNRSPRVFIQMLAVAVEGSDDVQKRGYAAGHGAVDLGIVRGPVGALGMQLII